MATHWTKETIAQAIQHTLIAADVTKERVLKHVAECVQYGFAGAMVQGSWVDVVAGELRGTPIVVASALDFPIVGTVTSAGKAAEAEELVRLGAQQIDIGVQIGWLKSGMFEEFASDIRGVVQAAGVPIKVMLELPMLTDKEKEIAIELSLEAGVKYLKNASSGSVEVANPASIAYLAERAPEGVGVKASGGITSFAQTVGLLAAGADMVGTSAGIRIVTDNHDLEEVSY
jgi:deoxyribose-phosphate aldolase